MDKGKGEKREIKKKKDTHPVPTQSGPLAQLVHQPLELSLQLLLSLPLLGRGIRQRKDPLLHNRPDVWRWLAGGHAVERSLERQLADGRDAVGARVLAAVARGAGDARNHGVPLGQAARDGAVDGGLAQVLGLGDGAPDEAVHHAVLETGQQLGREAVLHEQLVVLRLAVPVDDDVGAVAVRPQQDRLLVHLLLRQALPLVDRLEQRVGDAVGESCEFHLGAFVAPVWAHSRHQAHRRRGRIVAPGVG